jgi:hypothetical protein
VAADNPLDVVEVELVVVVVDEVELLEHAAATPATSTRAAMVASPIVRDRPAS